MPFEYKKNGVLIMPNYNFFDFSSTSAWQAMRAKEFANERYYAMPVWVEKVINQPMTDEQRVIYQREHRLRYFRKTPVYNAAPVYFDNPAFNTYMDATRPIRPEPRAKMTCSRCWRVVVKHLERVRNNIVVNFRKKINC